VGGEPGGCMAIDEIFPNPTVKVVIFQARFPSLFYLEEKMGSFQIQLMEEYPQSRLLEQKKVLFASIGPDAKVDDLLDGSEATIKKIWEFQSENRVKVNVSEDNISLTSEFHKSYQNEAAEVQFRDEIEFVMNTFLNTFPLPRFTRVGLRYVDECPLPSRTNESFLEYFNTGFPLDRFDVAETDELQLRVVVRRGDYRLRYFEKFNVSEGEEKVVLDFDAYATDVRKEDLLTTTDGLYRITSDEYEASIRQPLIEWMRSVPEER
jgi:uncharacterized protein (TIGR04255 family)